MTLLLLGPERRVISDQRNVVATLQDAYQCGLCYIKEMIVHRRGIGRRLVVDPLLLRVVISHGGTGG